MAEILQSTGETICLDDQRIIFLTDSIDMNTGRDITSKIVKWNLEDDEKDKKKKTLKENQSKFILTAMAVIVMLQSKLQAPLD